MNELTALEADEIKLLAELIGKHKDRIAVSAPAAVFEIASVIWGVQENTVLITAKPVEKRHG